MPEVLNAQERLVLRLRGLYEGCGFTRFPMRRFEEYALYLENKSFLTSEQVLSFTNANGKLMALKPDVTLSIVKQARADRRGVEKLYYNESVYRVSPTDHEFTEIQQLGVEVLGELDFFSICELVALAVQSLREVGAPYVLDIGHMGFTGGLMTEAGLTPQQRERAFELIRQKNAHELKAALKTWQIAPFYAERLAALPLLAGDVQTTLRNAAELALGMDMRLAVSELSRLYAALEALHLAQNVRLDFSIVSDLDYYNGLVFQGYVEGSPRIALSGGRYDRLMRKFGKAGDGLGFALYLDELSRMLSQPPELDADVLALYNEADDAAEVFQAAEALRAQGLQVLAACKAPSEARVGRVMRFDHGVFREEDGPC